MRQQVCDRLRGSVLSWQHDLQTRYGDPRVYAMQQAELNRRDAALAHDLSRRSHVDYGEVAGKARAAHDKRIADLRDAYSKRNGPSGSARRPRSAAARARTPPPPDAPPPAPP